MLSLLDIEPPSSDLDEFIFHMQHGENSFLSMTLSTINSYDRQENRRIKEDHIIVEATDSTNNPENRLVKKAVIPQQYTGLSVFQEVLGAINGRGAEYSMEEDLDEAWQEHTENMDDEDKENLRRRGEDAVNELEREVKSDRSSELMDSIAAHEKGPQLLVNKGLDLIMKHFGNEDQSAIFERVIKNNCR